MFEANITWSDSLKINRFFYFLPLISRIWWKLVQMSKLDFWWKYSLYSVSCPMPWFLVFCRFLAIILLKLMWRCWYIYEFILNPISSAILCTQPHANYIKYITIVNILRTGRKYLLACWYAYLLGLSLILFWWLIL